MDRHTCVTEVKVELGGGSCGCGAGATVGCRGGVSAAFTGCRGPRLSVAANLGTPEFHSWTQFTLHSLHNSTYHYRTTFNSLTYTSDLPAATV